MAAAESGRLRLSTAFEVPVSGPVQGQIRPPGSKSITNRALICAALARGQSTLRGALDSDDTRLMADALRQLGIDLHWDERDGRRGETIVVDGCGGTVPRDEADLFVGNSGTTMRFLAAMLATAQGTFRLHGTPRMHERPIGDLLQALRALGANVRSENDNDCPPIEIRANGLQGGTARIRGDISSQFLSGLLMAAPYAKHPVTLDVIGQLVSQPYVEMTLRVMNAFGVEPSGEPSPARFVIAAPLMYLATDYAIEPDASAASYFFAAAAITAGDVTVAGLGPKSLQGDVAFVDILERMGCQVDRNVKRHDPPQQASIRIHRTGDLTGVDVDMNAVSDTVQTLAAVALFAEGPTTIRNVEHIRHKETDRIGNLAIELRKLGAAVDVLSDGLRITPAALHGAEIETYDDHRMAMSLALPGLRVPGVRVLDPGCTSKTYPGFFKDLASISTEPRPQ